MPIADTQRLWVHILDIAVCTLVLRIVLGWLFTYRRLFWLLFTLIVATGITYLVFYFDLPFGEILAVGLSVPVAIIVFLSFLPELSRIYQSASHGNLFGAKFQVSEEVVPILANALVELSKKRRGALIILPRKDLVDPLVSGGEDLDAAVNQTLLLSIFNPKSPRHDGAMIIRGNRLVRVGAVLPLASAEGTDSDLGTRHLAALGLSERCDADVYVVSEERGTISHVREGKLKVLKPATNEGIRAALTEIMEVGEERSSTRNPLYFSLCLWFLSLILALLGTLKIYELKQRMETSPITTRAVNASIRLTGISDSDGFYVDQWETTTCMLTLRAPENITFPEALMISVDVSRQDIDKEKLSQIVKINLSRDMIQNLPGEVQVEKFEPGTIRVGLAKIRRRAVSMKMPAINGLGEELKIKNRKLEPDEVHVTVKNPKYNFSTSLATFPVDVSKLTEPGIYRIPVKVDFPAFIFPMGGDPKIELILELEAKTP